MRKENQLQVGLVVCETVLEALIRTHPNKDALRRELAVRFADLDHIAVDGSADHYPLGEQEQAHMKETMNAFMWQLNEHRKDGD